MGVTLLKLSSGLLVLLALAGCGPGSERGPHARVACAACHRGAAADSGRGAVTAESCARSGCHEDGGPDTVRLAGVPLAHRPHGGTGSAGCASCHSHPPESTALPADPSACALCHYRDIAGAEPACSTCHANPSHTRLTSQGVPITHSGLDAARVPCTRCHYQLVDGETAASPARCSSCHAGSVAAAPDSVHNSHSGLGCATCHQPVRHRVVAMSSSVNLECRDCHATRHRRPIPADTLPTAQCESCHQGVHSEAQRLVLGLLPDEPVSPSPMFMGGVTCRSCHIVPGAPPPRPGARLVTTEAACTGCHGQQWAGYLARWRRGYERRRALVAGYLDAAGSVLADTAKPAAARARLAEAAALMSFVQRAGPLHNLPATDRYMRRALEIAAGAYAAAALPIPSRPNLGPSVETGACLACHYGIEEAALARDSLTGRRATHGDHLFGQGLSCSSCHAVGAAPPGIADSTWIDTTRRRESARPRR